MHQQVCSALQDRYGSPRRETQYVAEWHVAPGLDVVVETRGSATRLWLPFNGNCPWDFARHAPAGDRVNSNVYAAPSLKDGNLLEVRVANPEDLSLLLGYIEGRKG